MSTESITERVVTPLGAPEAVNSFYTNKDNIYDVAIGGVPFFLGASNQYPYHRETATYKKEQVDLTQQPGEQTFMGWWLRSQSSFHLGAGINFVEPLDGNDVIYRFNKSNGVDVWTPGQVSLLPDTEKIMTVSSDINMIGGIDGNNVSMVLMSDDDALTRITSTGATGSVNYGGSGSDIVALTQDGTNYYAANSTGIYKGLLTGVGTGSKIYDTGTSSVELAWVKQRLMAAVGPTIYQLNSNNTDSATLPTGIYTHPNTSWVWTSIVESPSAIYASGYAGTSSSIIKISLDSNGAIPTLTSAVTAADFSDDEHVTSMGTYLGRYILIGTNKGIRVGQFSDTSGYTAGFVTYGPLTYTLSDSSHVTGFAFRDRFAYATVTNAIDGKSGVIRIDLSVDINGTGVYPWANDLTPGVTGNCKSIAFVGESGRLAFTVEGQGLYFQHTTNKVASGYLQTGALRFNTLEPKHFKLVKARVASPLDGPIGISTVSKDGTISSIVTVADVGNAAQDFTTKIGSSQEQLAFKFDLNRNATDATKGSVLLGYQVKALPGNKRNRMISVPVMNYDFETDRFNIMTGYEGRAWERLSALEEVESLGDTITLQDFTTGEQVEGLIEKMTFDRVSPPDRRFMGFGGIIYVSVRTV